MIEVRVLGGVVVEVDGERLALAPRATGVLVRLAMATGRLDADLLLVDLWGDDVEPRRRRSLQTIVSTLRAEVVGTEGIVFDAGGYRLEVEVNLDLHELLSSAATARRLGAIEVDPRLRERSTLHTLGEGHWVDETEQRIEAAQAQLAGMAASRSVEVRYVVADGRHLAYQHRPGPDPTVLLVPGLATHCEAIWAAPGFESWVDGVVGARGLILCDKRGTGLSDPVTDVPTAADFAADVEAVLEVVGASDVVVIAAAEAGLFIPQLAVARPDLIAGVVFVNAIPTMFERPDYPHGLPAAVAEAFGDEVRDTWARGEPALRADPSAPSKAGDPEFAAWSQRYQRLAATPGSIWQLARFTSVADARGAVASMTQPAIVLQSRHSRYFRPSTADWLARALATDEVTWLDSADHLFWLAEPERAASRIRAFVDAIGSR